MKRSLFAAATALLMITSANAAPASDQLILRTAGYWTAFYDPRNSDGVEMCGMKTDTTNGAVMVKYAGTGVFVQVFKSTWRIPNGTIVPVSLTFDKSDPWIADASGGTMDRSPGFGFVVFTIKAQGVGDFIREFGEAGTMTVGFTQGNEQPWTLRMSGSREVAASFSKCVTALAGRSSTQPHAGGSTTQPYGKPAPSQPYGKPKQQPVDDGGI